MINDVKNDASTAVISLNHCVILILDWYIAKLIQIVKESKLIKYFCLSNDSIGTSQEQISVIKNTNDCN